VPASLCGVFGLKPTFGRLPRTGSYPFVASLDHLGPFARTAADLALAYDAMQGPDPADPACAPAAAQPTLPLLEAGRGRACASACSAAGSARWRCPRRWPRSTPWPRRWA
jgi:1-carboxybiuret hydrolase